MKQTVLYLDTEEARISRVLQTVENTLENSDTIHVRNVSEAYRILLEYTIDVFIINISPDTSKVSDMEGLHLISAIREIPRYILTPVIILSSLQDPQLYAYEKLNCLGYLSKTFPTDKLTELLHKTSHYKTKRPEDKVIIFRKNRSMYPVPIKDIVYMTRENGMTKIHMVNGEILEMPYVSYAKLLTDTKDECLFMCNRSTIVNREYVYAVDPTNCFVVLRNGRGMLDIGLKYRAEINADFTNDFEIYYGQKKHKNWEE